jgi:hypothetical protein
MTTPRRKPLRISPKRRKVLWRDALEDLRTECPVQLPVKVSRRALPTTLHGKCTLIEPPGGQPYFSIVVEKTLHIDWQLEILMHEWAHALSWFAPPQSNTDHPDEWGLCFARCYRAVIHD